MFQKLQSLIPKVGPVIEHLIPNDEQRAVQLMGLWQHLDHTKAPIVSTAQMQGIAERCLDIAANRGEHSVGDPVRVEALRFLCSFLGNTERLTDGILWQTIPQILLDVMMEQDNSDRDDKVKEILKII